MLVFAHRRKHTQHSIWQTSRKYPDCYHNLLRWITVHTWHQRVNNVSPVDHLWLDLASLLTFCLGEIATAVVVPGTLHFVITKKDAHTKRRARLNVQLSQEAIKGSVEMVSHSKWTRVRAYKPANPTLLMMLSLIQSYTLFHSLTFTDRTYVR